MKGRVVAALLAVASPAVVAQSPAERDVIATVGERVIRMADVEARRRVQDFSLFNRLEQQLRADRRRALDDLVAEALLSTHAQREGVTLDRLREELLKKTAPDRRAYVAALRSRYRVDIVESFAPSRQAVPREPGDPVRGVAGARVEIVEFSDFECPYCRQLLPVLEKLLAKHLPDVRLVWKHFPLPMHQHAGPAAEAAACAGEQGRFWEYAERLFDNQLALERDDLRRYASDVGLDVPRFVACVASVRHRSTVERDMEAGRRLGVAATPTVFINGRMVSGLAPLDVYDRMILEELAAIGRPAACTGTVCSLEPVSQR